MPATAFVYVVVALLSRFWLHEHLSIYRWAGIVLIVCAVGFVAGGPSRTEHESSHPDLDLMDSGAGR
jgi:drug/metabolite transporter (DMT)-like permease